MKITWNAILASGAALALAACAGGEAEEPAADAGEEMMPEETTEAVEGEAAEMVEPAEEAAEAAGGGAAETNELDGTGNPVGPLDE